MDIVKMERNCLGDTRTATHMPTREEFRDANWSHKADVFNLAVAFSTELLSRVGNHDWTKVQAPYDEMFYDLMKATIEDDANFMDGEWARLHYDVLERHHLSRHCPYDVTLFDVLEMIFDCVSAGMTRSGSVYPIEISDEILQIAVSNTVDYLIEHIKVTDCCEHITEDGVTCAKYPACDDCPDNIEAEQMGDAKPIPLSSRITQTEAIISGAILTKGCKDLPPSYSISASTKPKRGEWISCKEKIPKNDDWKIITIRDESGDMPYIYSDFGWYFDRAECWIVDAEQRHDVIAWMPLPQPYRE